ncbi:hypothetical protein EJ02DRAFT_303935, partial [Clathrospora elynae]
SIKDRLKDFDYDNPAAPEDHLIVNINHAHQKLSKYYAKFDDMPVYYAAIVLHSHYKNYLEALWNVSLPGLVSLVPDDHNTQRNGPHYRNGWLINNHRAFLTMCKDFRERATAGSATSNSNEQQPAKKLRIAGPMALRSAFLKLQMDAAVKESKENLSDEYEQWKHLPPIADDNPMVYNPLKY